MDGVADGACREVGSRTVLRPGPEAAAAFLRVRYGYGCDPQVRFYGTAVFSAILRPVTVAVYTIRARKMHVRLRYGVGHYQYAGWSTHDFFQNRAGCARSYFFPVLDPFDTYGRIRP